MSARIELAGKRFGAWTVQNYAGMNTIGQPSWACLCDCGVERFVVGQTLRSGKTKSCGCQKSIITSRKLTPMVPTNRSGESAGRSAEYRAWLSMNTRCSPRNRSMRKNYYERGIYVCERWHDYQNFLADMGPIPHPGYTLDRIDNDGIYEPSNCRWADCQTQSKNRRPADQWA